MQTTFTGVAAHRLFGANLSYQGQTLSGQGLLVSGSYFPVLQLTPALGRLLGPEDDRAVGESRVVVLSHAYWATRFASNPDALNQQIIVNGQTLTIVGVAPRGFDGTTMGSKPTGVRADHLARHDGAGIPGLGQSLRPTGPTCSRASGRACLSRPPAPP